MNGAAPLVRDVVLVGGGHSHALLLRRWAMRPLPGVRLTLVSRDVLTTYSGMLPGLVAGHYTFDEVHIDLRRLCAWAGVRFVCAEMTALDMARREIRFDPVGDPTSDPASGHSASGRPPLRWDLLSLDTGSTPDLSVPGAREHVTPVKPVSDFHARWQRIVERHTASDVPGPVVSSSVVSDAVVSDADVSGAVTPDDILSIGVIGSGAGGFELIMAMRHALDADDVHCHWIMRGERPLAGRPARVGERALAAARRAGITVHERFDVTRVTATGVEAADGRFLALDERLWCTAASGPSWTAAAGLAVDARGFVLTDRHLRSVSHPRVFATGDIGTQRDTPSAKAGVFAVRQAPVLFENLRRTLLGEPLAVYAPQRDFLTLMALGERSAIGSRGPFVFEGETVWRWKDRIDRRFMRRFAELPPMLMRRVPAPVPDALSMTVLDGEAAGRLPVADADGTHGGDGDDGGGGAAADVVDDAADDAVTDAAATPSTTMRCRGCGAKVPGSLLDEVLAALPVAPREDVPIGLAAAGDAALLDPNGRLVVQSVDQLDAIVDDPWLFGRIATLHAVSDVVTQPGVVQSAQVLVTLPSAHERIVRRDLEQLMRGVVSALSEEGATLVGGHTAQGDTLALGLVVNALRERSVAGARALHERAATSLASRSPEHTPPRAGDVLVLTEPLGIGTLFAGLMRTRARGVDVQAALEIMSRGNRCAADTLRIHGARLLTDVTGFGLAGHLTRLLRGAAHGARVEVASLPLLPGAFALAAGGVHSSAWPASARALRAFEGAADCPTPWRRLLCDPQTGGGLLAVLPAGAASDAIDALRRAGHENAAVIGEIVASSGHTLIPPAAPSTIAGRLTAIRHPQTTGHRPPRPPRS